MQKTRQKVENDNEKIRLTKKEKEKKGGGS